MPWFVITQRWTKQRGSIPPVGLRSFSHLHWFSEKQSLPSSAESSSDPAPLLVSVKICQDSRENNHTLISNHIYSHDSLPMWEFTTFLYNVTIDITTLRSIQSILMNCWHLIWPCTHKEWFQPTICVRGDPNYMNADALKKKVSSNISLVQNNIAYLF